MAINRLSGYFDPSGPSPPPTSSVHEAIAQHQQNGGWARREAVCWLNQLKDLFVADFKIQIDQVVIGVAKLPVKVAGQYRESHNALGVEREVLLSAKLLDGAGENRLYEVAGELLHQLLHAEQAGRGGVAAKPGHHNKAFRRRAAELGLIVREDGAQGYRAGRNPLFTLLEGLGVKTPRLSGDKLPPASKPRGKSTLHKYACQCPRPQTFRSGRRDFRAVCPDCHSRFEISG